MKKQNIRPLLAYAVALVFTGCALNQAKGPLFSSPASPQTGQALIYIYRPPTEAHGYQRIYPLFANGKRLKDLKHGGYYPFETNPGHIQFSSNDKSGWVPALGGVSIEQRIVEGSAAKPAMVEFEAEAGRVYYVKFHPQSHAFYEQPQLFVMTDSDGENEIKGCKLISE
jgi:hypothetical protein